MTKPDWIHLYISISFWLCLIGVVVRLGCLSWHPYPRAVTWSRGEDAFQVLLGMAQVIFAWWLAWG
jgi:hypothetical protein